MDTNYFSKILMPLRYMFPKDSFLTSALGDFL